MAYEEQFGETGDTTGESVVGRLSYATKYASEFVYTGETVTITRIVAYVSRVLNPTFNVSAYIYTDTGPSEEPDQVVGTGSDAVAASTFGTDEGAVNFDNVSASLTNGTTYWVVLACSSYDADNHIKWLRASNGATMDLASGSGDAGSETWSKQGTTRTQKFSLWSGGEALNIVMNII